MAFDIRTSLAAVTQLTETLGQFGVELSSARNVWRLKMLDPPESEFVGMFIAQDLTENVGQRLSKTQGLNQQSSQKGYLGGAEDSITFNTRIWANNSVKNIKSSIDALKSFTKRDSKLKRAPIFKFTSGTEVACKCFVESVGGIKYDDPREDGSIRGASFSIALAVIEELPTKEQGLSLASLAKSGLSVISAVAGLGTSLGFIDIPGGSLHRKGRKVIVKQGQTFEQIAQLEYGDALAGDILRRVYYQQPLSQIKTALETGDYIDLVEDTDIAGIETTPQSLFLQDNLTNNTAIEEHFDRRGGDKTIFI